MREVVLVMAAASLLACREKAKSTSLYPEPRVGVRRRRRAPSLLRIDRSLCPGGPECAATGQPIMAVVAMLLLGTLLPPAVVQANERTSEATRVEGRIAALDARTAACREGNCESCRDGVKLASDLGRLSSEIAEVARRTCAQACPEGASDDANCTNAAMTFAHLDTPADRVAGWRAIERVDPSNGRSADRLVIMEGRVAPDEPVVELVRDWIRRCSQPTAPSGCPSEMLERAPFYFEVPVIVDECRGGDGDACLQLEGRLPLHSLERLAEGLPRDAAIPLRFIIAVQRYASVGLAAPGALTTEVVAACRRGSPFACIALTRGPVSPREGDSMPESDRVAALVKGAKARCRKGEGSACLVVAVSEAQDDDERLRWLRAGCAAKLRSAGACEGLSRERGASLPERRRALLHACDGLDYYACRELGSDLGVVGLGRDGEKRLREVRTKACRAGMLFRNCPD